MNVFETLRASAKNVWESFADRDICHRMVSLRKLYSVTLTFWRSKILNVNVSETMRAFCRFWHLPANDTKLWKLHLIILAYFFKVKNLKALSNHQSLELSRHTNMQLLRILNLPDPGTIIKALSRPEPRTLKAFTRSVRSIFKPHRRDRILSV